MKKLNNLAGSGTNSTAPVVSRGINTANFIAANSFGENLLKQNKYVSTKEEN